MSIKAKLFLTSIFFAFGIIVLLVSIMVTTERIKVNGPVYKEIVNGKDLVADILPPPEYIIEAYLVVLQALEEKDISKVPAYQERFKQLRSDYDERQNYWDKELPPGRIRNLLLEQSHKPAFLFFETATNKYFPALAAGRHMEAEKLLDDILKPSYGAHRKVIDEIVILSNAANSGIEKRAADMLHISKIVTVTISIIFSAIVLTIFYFIIRSITRQLNKAISIANRLAEGDLTVDIEVMSKDETGQFLTALKNMVERLNLLIEGVKSAVNNVSSSAEELCDLSVQMATGVGEVSAQTGTVAAASEEMASTSIEIAKSCNKAAEGSQHANESVTTGASIVQQSVAVMNRIAERVKESAKTVESLGERSDQIGAIIGTIEDIADQTNLLALNAAIEAARAGEQGRGFAVVADEVRALAERTTKATREIGVMIKAIQSETKGAVSAMEDGVKEVMKGTDEAAKSSQALQDILDQINSVTMQVSLMATAAEQQTAATHDITNNIQQITQVVQDTSYSIQDSANASIHLFGHVEELQRLISQFTLAA